MHKLPGAPRSAFGSLPYRERIKYLARGAHHAYAGGAIFIWLNRSPYIPEEEFDFFLAGKVFGAVLRSAYGGTMDWTDMHLAWVVDLQKLCEQHDPQSVLLDGDVEFPLKYVERLLAEIKTWI